MNIEEIREYCLSKEETDESQPFGIDSLVFKTGNRMFVLLSLTPPWWMNLKCDPEKALQLREHYPEITPGYHMNKKHWNTINLEGSLSDSFLKELIDISYDLVSPKKR